MGGDLLQKFEEMAAILGLVKAAGPTINGVIAISKVCLSSICHTISSKAFAVFVAEAIIAQAVQWFGQTEQPAEDGFFLWRMLEALSSPLNVAIALRR